MLVSGNEIKALIENPGAQEVEAIKVLLAHNKLPINEQVGPTCGIYALDAAFQIQGKMIAPRKQVFGDWRSQQIPRNDSMRGLAKEKGLTKIGEIGSAADLAQLAAAVGIKVEVKRFGSEHELWTLVQEAVNDDKGIVMPYASADNDGTPAWSMRAEGFAHWSLLFGYVKYTYGRGLKRVFMTTYGKYHEESPFRLFKSNQRIQDWPRQTWIKLTFWAREPEKSWKIWKTDWQAEKSLREDIGQMARNTGVGWGFGIGNSKNVLHKVLDPPNSRVPNLNFDPVILKNATLKTEDLPAVSYTKTLCGQCVVV